MNKKKYLFSINKEIYLKKKNIIDNSSDLFICKINNILQSYQYLHKIKKFNNAYQWFDKKKGILIKSKNLIKINLFKKYSLILRKNFLTFIKIIFLKKFNKKKIVFLNSDADLILIKNNLSLFYFNDKKRLKINHLLKKRNRNNFRTEKKAYEFFKNKLTKAPFNIPEIIKFIEKKNFCFLQDKIIYNDEALIPQEKLKVFLKKYFKFKKNCIYISTLKKEYPDQINYLQSTLDFKDLKLIKKKFLFSFNHGDLNTGNIIFNKNKFYLTDWENFNNGFFITDFLKLSLDFNFLFDLMKKLYKNNSKNFASIEETLKIYFILKKRRNDI